MTPFIYNQQFLREGLARLIASIRLPLTFKEDPRFVHFMHKYAQPVYHRIPRTTSHNDVIKCYLNEKQLIIEEFKKHSGIVWHQIYALIKVMNLLHVWHHIMQIQIWNYKRKY